MKLNFVEFGRDNTDRDPLIILHGLFGSAKNWTSIAKTLAETYRVITVDMPNHGESPWMEPVDYINLANAVGDFLDWHGLSGAAMIGHSMGGKTAMVLALLKPTLISRLIVVEIAPISYDHKNAHYINAMELVDLADLANLEDLVAKDSQRIFRRNLN